MAENETPKFYVEEGRFNGTLAWFSNVCVKRVELLATSGTWPDWITSGITSSEVTVEIEPLADGEDERSCTLSALTYDENDVLISDGTCGYTVEIIQKRNTVDYVLPTDEDMPKNILPGHSYECTVSGVSGGEEKEDGKYHVPSTGGITSFNSKTCRR